MTTVQAEVKGSRPRPLWKWLGLAFLAPPVLLVTVFAVGEGIGGEEGWWGHLIQLAIALALVAGAWFAPKVLGPLLILLGLAAVIAMLANGAPVGVMSSTVVLMWLPMAVSGVFFTLAGYGRRSSPPTTPDDVSGAGQPT